MLNGLLGALDSVSNRPPRTGTARPSAGQLALRAPPLGDGHCGQWCGEVSIIEHAHDSRTPAPAAWLLTGSVAVTLGSISTACTALPVDEFPAGMQRWVGPTSVIAVVVAITIGALRPAPIVLLCSMSALLLLVWLALFAVYLALGGDPEVTDYQLGHDRSSPTP